MTEAQLIHEGWALWDCTGIKRYGYGEFPMYTVTYARMTHKAWAKGETIRGING